MFARTITRSYHATRRLSSDKEGAIRAAGGAFSKREQAMEDLYFRRLEAAKIERLRLELEARSRELKECEEAYKERFCDKDDISLGH